MTMLKGFWGGTGAAAVTWAFAVAIAVAAQTPPPTQDASDSMKGEVAFRINAQPIAGALKEFASQAHLQLIYETTEVGSSIRSPIVAGEFTPEDALIRILAHTNLDYKIINNRTISIRSAEGASRSETTASNSAEPESRSSEKPALAETDVHRGSHRNELDVVVITAQKREESAFDVPISVIAVGANELEEREIITLEDLPSVVPDLAITNNGTTNYIEVRGISNITGTASLIGMYVDEADVTLGGAAVTQISPVVYDLERVEVLRGPQGTLYGEGSAGGTIRFITRNPDLNRFVFNSQALARFTEGGGPSERLNAVVNIPVVEDQLGLRLATTFEHAGGWIDQPAADQKNINAQDLTNVRVKGLWKPDPHVSVSAMVIISRNSQSTNMSDSNSPATWTQVFNLLTTPRIKSDYNLYNLTTTYDISPAVRILNTTSYLKASAPGWNESASYPLTPPGTPRTDFYGPYVDTEERLFTDELRLTSNGSAPWQWTLGGFYRHYRDFTDQPVGYFDVPGPPGAPLPAPYAVSQQTIYKSWSAFGDTSYRLWERFTIGAGVRYFLESQDFSDFVALTQQAGRFHSIDPRVYAQFGLTRGVNVYASAAKGFRSGGFNGFGQPSFEPEGVWTYELGTKMALAEGRLNFDTAVFLTKYAHYQSFGLVGANGASYITDVGSTRIRGIEWDWTWRPWERWRLDVRGDYLNGRFTSINAAFTAYAIGDPVDLVPRYQFSISGEHDVSLLGKHGSIRLDYSQQGPETLRNRSINGPFSPPSPWYYGESDVIHTLNLNASMQLKDNLRVGFIAQNLLNDQGFVNPLNFTNNGVRSRPRTFGVDFSVTLD